MQHLRCEEGHIHKVMWLLSLPSGRLVFPCSADCCCSLASQFMPMTSLIGSPICLQTARRLVDGRWRKRPPLRSGISIVSHFLPSALGGFSLVIYLFCLHLGRLDPPLAREGWGGVVKMDQTGMLLQHQQPKSLSQHSSDTSLPVASQSGLWWLNE